MATKELIRTLECADCGVKAQGEVSHAFNAMRLHVQQKHGRNIVFKREQYERLTPRTKMYSTHILDPKLIIAA